MLVRNELIQKYDLIFNIRQIEEKRKKVFSKSNTLQGRVKLLEIQTISSVKTQSDADVTQKSTYSCSYQFSVNWIERRFESHDICTLLGIL
jgi:hypothetical protein